MNIIEVCAQACQNSYQGKYGKVIPVLEDIIEFKKGHVEGHIGRYGLNWVLVFRGSWGWKDWFDNFKFWKIKTPKEWFGKSFRCYTGFVNQCKIIYKTIIRLVEGKDNIAVTGHSLGGALATIFALILVVLGKRVQCYTFGSPRVGTVLFTKFFNKHVPLSLRFKYGEDSVTKVPPVWMFYRHVDKKKQLGKESFLEKLLFPIRKIIGNPIDHYPQDYVNSV